MKTLIDTRFAALILAAIACFGVKAYAHITPTVVMAKRGDVIRNSLPAATNYFVRKVTLGQRDYAKIKAQGNFSPEVSELKFFYGKNASGGFVGTVLFDEVNTIHGPIEVGIAFTPSGTVSDVVVTKATVETEPWVKTAISSGLMKNFTGMSAESMTDPLKGVSKSTLGAMPYFMAQVITTAVIRGVIYYNVLFQTHLPS